MGATSNDGREGSPTGADAPAGELWSDCCPWEGLFVPPRSEWLDFAGLALVEDWAKRWTSTWRVGSTRQEVVCPLWDLASMPVEAAQPVRRFSWRTTQRHRPGLQYMVSTGRHCGFESLEEAKLLLALDFAGRVSVVLSQPFRLRFTGTAGVGEHIPDFLVVTAAGTWLVDVRPACLVTKYEDRVRFAAAFEAALSAGWRYALVTGWWPNVQASLDMLSSQRRPLADPLNVQSALLAAVGCEPVPFGELTSSSDFPPMARAHALHLIWRRRLAVDLAEPLTESSMVRMPSSPAGLES